MLGLVTDGTGVAANVPKNAKVSFDQIRIDTVGAMTAGPSKVTIEQLPFAASSKGVLGERECVRVLDEAQRRLQCDESQAAADVARS
ncbi:MAG: hypothetical protein ACI89X_002594 [Planctomycetota bacterium]